MTSLLDTIDWGDAHPDDTVTVRFVRQGMTLDAGYDGFADFYTADGWTAAEKARITAAMDRISQVADIDFVINGRASADFQLMLDLDEMHSDTLGFFNPPGDPNSGVGVFNGRGSIWDRSGVDMRPGSEGFALITHEVLHGLGLAHPHDRGGTSTIMSGVTSEFDDYGTHDLNQGIFTTMSYNTGYHTGAAGQRTTGAVSYGYEIGPMALDIAVLQAHYGANMGWATGNNSYLLPTSNTPGTGWRAIWDAGGLDEIRINSNRDAVIDLRAATLENAPGGGGYVSGAANVEGGLTIAYGVVIERGQGGGGDDLLIGNAANNRLHGGTGDDVLRGAAGNDLIDGDRGRDRLLGGGGQDTLLGGQGRDRLEGGSSADLLVGEGGRDILRGDQGRDRLQGGAERDILRGGANPDTFDFNSIRDSRTGADRRDLIADFTPGEDRIDLRSLDANRAQAGDQAFDFIGFAGFSATGQVRMQRAGDHLRLLTDSNGDGRPDLEILLADLGALAASDILL